MTRLLEIKAILVTIYKRFDRLINPAGKFVVSLMIIISLNKFSGIHRFLPRRVSMWRWLPLLLSFRPVGS